MTGAMAKARDLTIRYARERHQFGQPLIRYQAIQHQLTELSAQAAAADTPSATQSRRQRWSGSLRPRW